MLSWDMTLGSSVHVYRRFGESFSHLLQELNMEAMAPIETTVTTHQTTRHYI
jgi:hypothetical protein